LLHFHCTIFLRNSRRRNFNLQTVHINDFEINCIKTIPLIPVQVKESKVGGACGTHEREKCIKGLVRKPEERDHPEDRDVEGRMVLELISRKLSGSVWIGFIWLRIGTGGG
jgi:hypothetical protein